MKAFRTQVSQMIEAFKDGIDKKITLPRSAVLVNKKKEK